MKGPALRPPRSDRSMRVLVFLLSVAALVCPSRAQNAGFPIVTTFSATEIGTDAMSWTTVQDSDGVLLFGCNTALASYDGERWQTSRMDGGYALRGLDLAADGRLWAAANGEIGWFERQHEGRWSFHSLRQFLPLEHRSLGEVWNVFSERNGAIFVTDNKILRWDGQHFRVWSLTGTKRLTATRAGGRIYVHYLPEGLYRMDEDGPKVVIPAAVLAKATVCWMEPRADGWLLATSKGLFTYTYERLEPFAPEASQFIQSHALTSTVRLADGRLLLGTYQGGLMVVSPTGVSERILDESSGLPTNAIYSLFVDRENGVWATSPSHIFRIALNSPSVQFDRRSGLPAQPFRRIVRNEGNLLTATENGVYALQADAREFRQMDQLRERLWDLQTTPHGLLAAGTYNLSQLTSGVSTVLRRPKRDIFLAQPSQMHPDRLLLSEGHDIVLLDDGGQTRIAVRDLPDIAISMAEDNSGVLWFGTFANGILMARPNPTSAVEATAVSSAQGLPESVRPGSVVGTPDGAILAFSSLGGWIKGPAAERFIPITGYPQRGLSAVSNIDADGAAWVILSETQNRPLCIGRVAIVKNHATWRTYSIEGLWTIGIPQCVFVEEAGGGSKALWIGGTNGILRTTVTPEAGPPAPQPPLLHAFVRNAGRDTPEPMAKTLPYSTYSVLFEFAEPKFSVRPALRLETRLDGVDNDWVPADASSRREFTAMRDGQYVFRVRCVAETDATSESTVLGFTIAAPWWRTGPAVAGELLALGTILYGFYYLRLRALRRRNAELEEKVLERTEELVQASAAKTQFVANMSHDIRNPLNGIVGLTLALEDSQLDAKQQAVVATLRECTTYLSSLVDDVLDFASIEAGRVELRQESFSPIELLRSVMTTLQPDAIAREATVVLEADPNLPGALVGDAGRIQQILVNYGSNALKYAGGTIRFSAKVLPDAQDEIEFAVADEGPGFSAAEQAGLFVKFNRLPSARQSDVAGTGLGLASCRLLADLMGGSVGVESGLGRGARFYLHLPLSVSTEPASAAVVSLPNATVLIVEDTDYNAMAAAAVLARLGLASERARTGQEALELFSAKRFNVVLLDRNLPDLDGTEVARRIRQLEGDVPQAILLAVTAYCTEEDRKLCLDAGMDAFVGKPLTPVKLRKALITTGRRLLTAASVQVPPDPPKVGMDFTLLDYISDGTAEGRAAQIDRFLAALAEAEIRLNEAVAAHNLSALADAAHAVLAQAKFVGATMLEQTAILLEQTARAHDDSAFGQPLQNVREKISAVTAAMDRQSRVEPSA